MKKYIGYFVVLAFVGFIMATTMSCNKKPAIDVRPIYDTTGTGNGTTNGSTNGSTNGGTNGTVYTTGTLEVQVKQFKSTGQYAMNSEVHLAYSADSVLNGDFIFDVQAADGIATFENLEPRDYFVYAVYMVGSETYDNSADYLKDHIYVAAKKTKTSMTVVVNK